ncbi:hypothetical protein ACLI1A_02400 [Flavobacterium sp. RHBU_3]|uniref:hypothetical protein n=1 Tax=Flavobacterium sp. RHBU_3 TaxID=3391184 RepID=UPI003984D620
MKNAFYLMLAALAFVGCSTDKEFNTSEEGLSLKNRIEENSDKGAIPVDSEINKVSSGEIKPGSLSEMIDLYQIDTQKSEGTAYDTNLKNRWLFSIYKPLLSGEATEEEKKFFIQEQLKMEHNLPHIANFYKLLSITSGISEAEKEAICSRFKENNDAAIADIQWHTAEEKKQKQTELLLAGRNYWLLKNAVKK